MTPNRRKKALQYRAGTFVSSADRSVIFGYPNMEGGVCKFTYLRSFFSINFLKLHEDLNLLKPTFLNPVHFVLRAFSKFLVTNLSLYFLFGKLNLHNLSSF